MTPKTYLEIKEILFGVILIELNILIIIGIYVFLNFAIQIQNLRHTETIYYFQNCNNLTLFPDGCRVYT